MGEGGERRAAKGKMMGENSNGGKLGVNIVFHKVDQLKSTVKRRCLSVPLLSSFL